MSRNRRLIELDAPVVPSAVQHEKEFRKSSTHRTETTTTYNEYYRGLDDILHITTTTEVVIPGKYGDHTRRTIKEWHSPCFVDFEDILACCKVEHDDPPRFMPWEEYDGWEHDCETFQDWRSMRNLPDETYYELHFKEQRGYFCSNDYRGREAVNIQFCDVAKETRDSIYEGYRRRGASKQVAAEMTAQWVQEYIDHLVKWHRDGIEYWYVACTFSINDRAYGDGIDGFEELEYAETEGVYDAAAATAIELEHDGYIVRNWGKPKFPGPTYRQQKQQEQNWKC